MEAWKDAKHVEIPSTKDGTLQPAWFYIPYPPSPTPLPLLVALHTWSADYMQENGFLAECKKRKWVMIQPNFRGPNNKPEACGSNLAVQDVLDAVEYARKNAPVDERRIYLVGASGGGFMALVMAHRAPHVWAGVSAWVPITDLFAWHRECKATNPPRRYYIDIEKSCGGPPGAPKVDAEYRARSPIFHLAAARGVRIDINAGIQDGHTGSVPISHSLRAFNVLAQANGCPDKLISDQDIMMMTRDAKVPDSLNNEKEDEPGRRHKILFRRIAGPVRVTIFEGGHEIDVPCALNWLAQQAKP